ncbi:MAG: hypothetical protein ABW221_00320 [Vicinamibacteria bacterium]
MSTLDESSDRALTAVNALFATAEAARARFADLREQVAAATERMDADWALLRERAGHFQQQAASESQTMAAGQAQVQRALETLHGAAAQVLDEVPPEIEATHGGFEEIARGVDSVANGTVAAIHEADEAEAALLARTEEVEAELSAALLAADQLLRSELAEELKQFEAAVQEETDRVATYLGGECLEALEGKARELYEVLVQADTDMRAAVEAATQACEESAEAALRDCSESYDQRLSEAESVGRRLETVLEELRDFIDDGRERLDDRQELWNEQSREAREVLRDALDRLKELEDHISHFKSS